MTKFNSHMTCNPAHPGRGGEGRGGEGRGGEGRGGEGRGEGGREGGREGGSERAREGGREGASEFTSPKLSCCLPLSSPTGVTNALRNMNKRLNLPELQKIMMQFERESEIMDLKEETISDTIDDVISGEDDEEVGAHCIVTMSTVLAYTFTLEKWLPVSVSDQGHIDPTQ